MNADGREFDIETMLDEAGARWRAQQPEPPDFTLPRTARNRSLPLAVGSLVAAAAVALVLIGGLVWGPVRQTARETVAPVGGQATSSQSGSSPVVRDGDPVTASGRVLLASSTQTPVLCRFAPVVQPYIPDYSPSCPPVQVVLNGLNVATLPGWHRAGGDAWISSDVKVSGSWQSGQLNVSDVVAAHAPALFPEIPGEVPCSVPETGWPGNGDVDTMEAATARLDGEITSNPELYSGYWWASIGAGAPRDQGATVVGTVGDVNAVRAALEKVYPFNLCVIKVAYSRADLDAVATKISDLGTAARWQASVWPALDKVLVQLVAFDEDADRLLSPYRDSVEIESLVVRGG